MAAGRFLGLVSLGGPRQKKTKQISIQIWMWSSKLFAESFCLFDSGDAMLQSGKRKVKVRKKGEVSGQREEKGWFVAVHKQGQCHLHSEGLLFSCSAVSRGKCWL